MSLVVGEVVNQVKDKKELSVSKKPIVKAVGSTGTENENEVREAELLYEICLPSPPRSR